MPDPLDPVEALRQIAGLCQRCIPGTPWEPALGRHRPYCASRIAIAALAALPAPVPEGVPEDRTPFAVPDRIAIDANGYGWRVFGHGTDDETWSMVPVNPDNTAPPQPMSWYVPAPAEPREVIDQAGIDHILAALIEVGPWEDMDDLDGEGTEASIIADHIRDLPRLLSPPPGEPESEKP